MGSGPSACCQSSHAADGSPLHRAMWEASRRPPPPPSPSQLSYPMYVLPMQEFLKLDALVPHQDLLGKNVLVEYQPRLGPAVYVSHQWCARRHPDPRREQLGTLQAALRNLLQGSAVIGTDWVSSTLLDAVAASPGELAALRSGFVWYDFVSIPQTVARSSAQVYASDVQAAIDSLPTYVGLSTFFVIAAPSLPHTEIPGQTVDYDSWKARGWCRLERLARHLSVGKRHMILVRSPDQLCYVSGIDTLHDAPGRGAFSAEGDRVALQGAMRTLLEGTLEALLGNRQLHDYRVLNALREHLLAGLSEDDGDNESVLAPSMRRNLQAANRLQRKPTGAEKRASLFLLENGFRFSNECDANGWRPIHYASITGDPELLAGLVTQKADVNATTTAEDCKHLIKVGATPLMLCTRFGRSQAALSVLLVAGADANARSSAHGETALHYWGFSGQEDCLRTLLLNKADINARGHLTSVVENAALYGRSAALRRLAEFGARLAPGVHGASALFLGAQTCTDRTLVQFLVDSGSSVNLQFTAPWTTVGGGLVRGAGLAYRLGRPGAFEWFCFHAPGSTPLHAAALAGNTEFVSALLDARADTRIRNEAGSTALQIALAQKHRALAQLLLDADWEGGSSTSPAARAAARASSSPSASRVRTRGTGLSL